MSKFLRGMVLACAIIGAPSLAATTFEFDEQNSFVDVTSNSTTCRLLGTCPLTASLATPFPAFTLNVGESRQFNFANLVVGSGIGTGSATLDAQLAFLLPASLPVGTTGSASYFRIGGLFTPGVVGGSLTWSDPIQELTASNGTRFSVEFGNLSGAQFGGRVVAPVTLTLLADAPAVPEPASWAMMIAGFGLVGAVFRRRGRRTKHAVATA
jgi:hypothetical protein